MKHIISAVLLSTACAVSIAQTPGGYTGSEPNVELRVSVNGQTVIGTRELEKMRLSDDAVARAIEQNAIPMARGTSVQLKVEVIEPNGIANDVTASPATIYSVVSTKSLAVTGQGLATALPGDQPSELGDLFVFYNTPQKSGFNRILFRIQIVANPINSQQRYVSPSPASNP